MNRHLFIALLLYSFSQASFAQNFLSWQFKDRYFSTTIGTGTSTYFGELNYRDKFSESLSLINAGIEARLLSRIAARVEASYFTQEGTDRLAPDSSFQRQRNLDFNSRNFHAQLHLMYYFKPYTGDYHSRWKTDFYAFSGVGYLFYSPRADLGGESILLRPARTEGVSYSKWTLTIPAGVGVKFKINEFTNINFEVSYHYTFTDYLDDVSDSYPAEFANDTQFLLSDRKDEIGVVNPEFYDQIQPGAPRGDPSNNDTLFQMSLRVELFIPPELFSGKQEPVIKKPAY